MKRWFGWVMILCVIMGVAVAFAGCKKRGIPVSEIRTNPDVLKGTVTVQGVVGAYAKNDQTLFGLMDVTELQCTTANCEKFYLPVRPSGAMPKLGDEVTVTGAMAQEAHGAIFVATKLNVIRTHKMGG